MNPTSELELTSCVVAFLSIYDWRRALECKECYTPADQGSQLFLGCFPYMKAPRARAGTRHVASVALIMGGSKRSVRCSF